MRHNRKVTLGVLAACGAALGASTVASAQSDPRPFVVHISGATLLENYLSNPAATLDFIDVDGNRASRGFPSGAPERQIQQLAPFDLPSFFGGGSGSTAVWSAGTHLGVAYSAVGSTRGLQELIDNGRTFNLGQSGRTAGAAPLPAANSTMGMNNRSSAFFNRYKYIVAGQGFDDNTDPSIPSVTFITNDGNAGGLPIRVVAAAGPDQFKALFTTPQYNGGSMMYLGSTSPTDGLSVQGGVTVDAAILDVPVRYAVTQTGAAAPSKNPGEVGYGNNGAIAKTKSGVNDTGTNGNKLASLTGGANINTSSPDANTIFDTPLFFAPIAPTANFGIVGGTIASDGASANVVKMTDLQYLFGAGRASTGENLMVVTRDSGSGTRNGYQNAIGQDPSWGVGENIGSRNNSVSNDRAGASFLPSNKAGNPRVEETVYNSRLAVGYVGPERGLSNSSPDVRWLESGYADILSVINDLPSYGGTTPQRPTLTAILDNSTGNSWVIGGPAALGTFGNPRANAPEAGGHGWLEPYSDTNGNSMYDVGEPFSDFNSNSVRDSVDTGPAPAAFPMRNAKAAAFVNNISRSIDLFESGFVIPFTPGEYAATQFILANAQPRQQNPNNPTNLIVNAAFNASLQNFILTQSGNIQGNSNYASFGTGVAPVTPSNSRAGKVPSRLPGTYSDSTVNAQAAVDGSYISQGGATISGGTGGSSGRGNLPLRNLVAGDFNADGDRNVLDAGNLIAAWRQRTGGPAWVSPAASGKLASIAASSGQAASAADAVIEVLGDFNADGNFDKHDLRYWADGLALAVTGPKAGQLDRKAAFTALDNELSTATAGADNNVFNSVLATNPTNTPGCGKVYQPGDSRGDIANADRRVTPGFQPMGAEGYAGYTPADANTINGADIDYVYRQFRQAGVDGCEVDWAAEYDEALISDLSADIDGDLKINQADVDELVKTILGTCYGDVNLDGSVNNADIAIVNASIANPPAVVGWSSGDLDGNGVVNAADLSLVCIADINCSGSVTVQDIFDFLAAYFSNCPKADVNGAGGVSVQDIFDFLAVYFAGGCPGPITCP